MKKPNPGDLSRIDDANPSSNRGPSATLVALAIVVAITVTFVLQNSERTSVQFLFFDVRARTWTAIGVAVVLGALLDRLFLVWRRKRRAAKAAAERGDGLE